ncbi:MAG: sugar phosphate nucleotidyltransferase, partial [Verrucomicrobiales bacterium]
MKAFVLGAGLGTRLQPLTEWLPKPMVPVYHRPLISYAFNHVRSLPDLEGYVVNTHHYPEAYTAAFPESAYNGLPIAFRHEPILLETAGGIANIADLLGRERFLVYNGDILSDIPLAPLLEAHERGGHEVT